MTYPGSDPPVIIRLEPEASQLMDQDKVFQPGGRQVRLLHHRQHGHLQLRGHPQVRRLLQHRRDHHESYKRHGVQLLPDLEERGTTKDHSYPSVQILPHKQTSGVEE